MSLEWWVCRCGRKLYEHSSRTKPSTGGREYVCMSTRTGRYEPETLPELDYTPERGLHRVALEERSPVGRRSRRERSSSADPEPAL